MATRISWAAAKVNAAGAFVDQAGFVLVTKTGTGVYELELADTLGVPECCPTVTAWYRASIDPPPLGFIGSAGLKSDGKTLVVNMALGAVPTDAAFCVVVDRFAPS